jgi:hypothetical protein
LEGVGKVIELGTPDDINQALKRLVDALGGAKVVGHKMRPEKTIFDARVWLLNCLNPDRQETLHPEQVLLLLRWGHHVGHHDAMAFIASDTGYAPPAPVTETDALADLQRKAIAAAEKSQALSTEVLARMQAAGIKVDP